MPHFARHLIFHGAIVLIIGLLCGAPYGRAVNRNAPGHIQHAWRVAHASLPMGAILMFAIGGVMSTLSVPNTLGWILALTLIVSGYAFCFSLTLAPVVGHRGLSSKGPLSAKLVYYGNVAGAATSLIGALLFLYAAFLAL